MHICLEYLCCWVGPSHSAWLSLFVWLFFLKSWRQHPTKHQLYGHLLPITKTIQVRRTRHAGHCWRSKDELVSDVLLWTPTYGCAKAGWPARTYIQQLCEDTGCNPEDLPEAMNDREKWRERVRDISACGATWWWWWILPSLLRCSRFFVISMNSSVFFFLVVCWDVAKDSSLLSFGEVRSSYNGIFLLIRILYILVSLDIPSGGYFHVNSRCRFLGVFS